MHLCDATKNRSTLISVICVILENSRFELSRSFSPVSSRDQWRRSPSLSATSRAENIVQLGKPRKSWKSATESSQKLRNRDPGRLKPPILCKHLWDLVFFASFRSPWTGPVWVQVKWTHPKEQNKQIDKTEKKKVAAVKGEERAAK
jgi:hypothetical protein